MAFGSILKVVRGIVLLRGATTNTLIGNVGDRLKVDGSVSPIPKDNIVYKSTHCLNAGSKAMNVNGSVTPVNFDFTPANGETWYLESLGFIIFQGTSPDLTDFGAIAGPLTNGLDIRIRTQGTEYTFATLKDNMDIVNVFGDFGFIPPTTGGFMNDTDVYFCTCQLQIPIKLSNSTSDYVRFRVQDNLSTITQMRGLAKVWRTI